MKAFVIDLRIGDDVAFVNHWDAINGNDTIAVLRCGKFYLASERGVSVEPNREITFSEFVEVLKCERRAE